MAERGYTSGLTAFQRALSRSFLLTFTEGSAIIHLVKGMSPYRRFSGIPVPESGSVYDIYYKMKRG